MNGSARMAASWVGVMAVVLLLSGCLGTGLSSNSTAYVMIKNADEQKIITHVLRGFADDGYRLATKTDEGLVADGYHLDEPTGEGLVFEREATRREQVLYGRYGETLIMRVVVSLRPLSDGSCMVESNAYMRLGIRVDKLLNMSRRPYQSQLNRIKRNIAQDPQAVAAPQD